MVKKISIDLALTLDGSNLKNNLSFVMAGLKFVALAVCNSMINNYKLDPTKKDCVFWLQSREWCFPLKVCMGRETTKI